MKITFESRDEALRFYNGVVLAVWKGSGALHGSRLGAELSEAAELLAPFYFADFVERQEELARRQVATALAGVQAGAPGDGQRTTDDGERARAPATRRSRRQRARTEVQAAATVLDGGLLET